MPATDDDTLLPFSLPPLCHKKVSAAFDGGTISSDGGVFLLAGADKRLGLIDRLASHIPDSRDPNLISHSVADILRERIFCVSGYSPLRAVIPTATIWTSCAKTPHSKWPAAGCRKPAWTWPRNQPSRGWKTPPTCAT